MIENKLKRSTQTRLGKLNLTTTVVTILGPIILIFATGGITTVLLQMDPLVYFIPKEYQWNLFVFSFRYIIAKMLLNFDLNFEFNNLKNFRLLITWLAIIEVVSTIGIARPTFFALYIHAKSLLYHLLFYSKRRLRGFKSKDKSLNRARDVLIYQTYEIAMTVRFLLFIRINSIYLAYLKAMEIYFLQIFRKYMDVAGLCALSTGMAFGVLANYSVIKLYGKMPILIYMYSVLLAVLVPLIMGALMPLAAIN